MTELTYTNVADEAGVTFLREAGVTTAGYRFVRALFALLTASTFDFDDGTDDHDELASVVQAAYEREVSRPLETLLTFGSLDALNDYRVASGTPMSDTSESVLEQALIRAADNYASTWYELRLAQEESARTPRLVLRDLTREEAALEEGGDAAREFAAYLRDDQLAMLVVHGPARLLDDLTTAQDVLLPDPPYDEDPESSLHDEWCTAFWQTLEGMHDYRVVPEVEA